MNHKHQATIAEVMLEIKCPVFFYHSVGPRDPKVHFDTIHESVTALICVAAAMLLALADRAHACAWHALLKTARAAFFSL